MRIDWIRSSFKPYEGGSRLSLVQNEQETKTTDSVTRRSQDDQEMQRPNFYYQIKHSPPQPFSSCRSRTSESTWRRSQRPPLVSLASFVARSSIKLSILMRSIALHGNWSTRYNLLSLLSISTLDLLYVHCGSNASTTSRSSKRASRSTAMLARLKRRRRH